MFCGWDKVILDHYQELSVEVEAVELEVPEEKES
jgi:hypothetical protein